MVSSGGSSTRVVQISNIAPQATKDQMHSIFGYLGKIEDIRLYPTVRDVSCPVASRICYVRFYDSSTASVAQHMTNTVFIDRALIVIPVPEIPDEHKALEMASNGTLVPGLSPAEPHLPAHVVNSLEGAPPNQILQTHDPRLVAAGLPQYPPLPATYDTRTIEEARRTVLVLTIPEPITSEQLIKHFSQAGEVKYMRYGQRENDPSRYALIEFTDQSNIIKALKLHGSTIDGHVIKVYHSTQAITKPQAKSNEAAQREIEEAMCRVKEAQNLISAAIDPVIGLLSKEKRREEQQAYEQYCLNKAAAETNRLIIEQKLFQRRLQVNGIDEDELIKLCRKEEKKSRFTSDAHAYIDDKLSKESRLSGHKLARTYEVGRSSTSGSRSRSRSRSRRRSRSKSRRRSRSRHRTRRSRSRHRRRSRSRPRHRTRSRSSHRSSRSKRSRSRSKHRSSRSKRDHSRDRDKDRKKDKDKTPAKEVDKDPPEKEEKGAEVEKRSKSKDRKKTRSKSPVSRKRSRSRDRKRSRSRDRDRDRKRSRSRDRKRSRSKERKRSKSRDRDRDRKRSRSRDKKRSRSRDRKRSRSKERKKSRSPTPRSKTTKRESSPPPRTSPSSPPRARAEKESPDNMDISNSP